MSESDRTWQYWGRADPYFGVLSHPKFRKDGLAENRSEFFESGTRQVQSTLALLDEHFAPPPRQRGRALDFGGGVGRITLPLARAYKQVVGVDISPDMLETTSSNARDAGLNNVDVALSDDHLSAVSGLFDLVHTYIVLQHIPVDRGMAIIASLMDRVAPGGLISLHMSVAQEGGSLRALLYALRTRVPGVNFATELVKHGRSLGPMMKMHDYPLLEVLRLFSRKSFGEVAVKTERHGNCLTCYMMAKRSDNFVGEA